MKNKIYIIILFFIIYFCSFFFYGKNTLGLEIIKNNTFHKNHNSIQIQIYNLDDYRKNEQEIASILDKKGFKTVKINYAENYLNTNKYSYWLEIQELAPFITFAYDGYYKKKEISEEYESLYIWCFIKWVKVYKNENSKKGYLN